MKTFPTIRGGYARDVRHPAGVLSTAFFCRLTVHPWADSLDAFPGTTGRYPELIIFGRDNSDFLRFVELWNPIAHWSTN